MAKLTKAEKQAERALKAQRRQSIQADIVDARVRTAIGFAGAYVGEQVAIFAFPSLSPDNNPQSPANAVGGLVDLAMLGYGGYKAAKDFSETGDYALGVALAGGIQTLDRVVAMVTDYIAKKQAA